MAAVKRSKPKKRSPLRKITAKKTVSVPKDVPVGPKQVRYLRSLGHALQPVVQVGKNGVTAELVKQTQAQLLAHELLKIKVAEEDRDARQELAQALAKACSAVLVQVLGRTVLLYKRHPKTPKISLPRAKAPGAAQPQAAAKPAAALDFDDEDGDFDDEDGDFDDEE